MVLLTPKLIENESEYEASLERIEEIFDAVPGTPEEKELKLLVLLVQHYESEHHPVPDPDPIEAIKVRMEDLGLKDKDLIPYIGDKTAVSKVLNRKRGLTIEMARKLHKGLEIPAEVLLAESVYIPERIQNAETKNNAEDLPESGEVNVAKKKSSHRIDH